MASVSMPNYGLLNNIASGLREGMTSYMTMSSLRNQQNQLQLAEQHRQVEEARQAQQDQMNMKIHGLIKDPTSGGLIEDPAHKQQEYENEINKGALEGKIIGQDESGNLAFKGYSEPYLAGQERINKAKGEAFAAPRNEANNRMEHQNAVNEIEKDQSIKGLLSTYQNLDNAEKNFSQGGKNPQEFNELQQAVRSNLGIKGAGGVGEREETYLKSLGLDAAKFRQFLSGKPEDAENADPEFVKQILKLVDMEKGNKRTQAKGLLDAKSKAHASFYQAHPDRAQDYEGVKNGYLAQFAPSTPSAAAQPISPEDQQAVEWAKANSKDPRAIQILKMHGM